MTRILFVADVDEGSAAATRAVGLIIGLLIFRAPCAGGQLFAPFDLTRSDVRLALVRVYELRGGSPIFRSTCCVQRALAGMWSVSNLSTIGGSQ